MIRLLLYILYVPNNEKQDALSPPSRTPGTLWNHHDLKSRRNSLIYHMIIGQIFKKKMLFRDNSYKNQQREEFSVDLLVEKFN